MQIKNVMVFVVLLLVAKVGTAQDRKQPKQDVRKPQRAKYLDTVGEQRREVTYKTISGRELKLDLYYPEKFESEKVPVVVFTHGGGWAAGSRYKLASGAFAAVFRQLSEAGFAVVPVSYRLAKQESGTTIRDCVVDCKDALRFLAKNSDTLKLDSSRFCVMGDSAGGHLAQMLLLSSPDQLPGDEDLAGIPYRMVAGVSWYGPCDFERIELFNHDDRDNFRDRFATRILGADLESQLEPSVKLARYREVSPINYLNDTSPPLLMIQGDKDTTIPVKHARLMKEKAVTLDAPVETMIISNAGHNWRKVQKAIEPSRDEIIEHTVQFLVEHAAP